MEIIGMAEIGNKKKRQEKRAARKEKRQEKKKVRHTKRAEKKTVRQEKRQARGGSRLKKVALAAPRAGFTIVLKTNLFKIATKMAQAYARNPAAVKKFAARFGYKWTNFATYVNQGAKTQISGAYLGAVPVAVAIANASAIIAAAFAMFKQLGIDPGKKLQELVSKDPQTFQDDPTLAAGDPEPGAEPAPEPAQSAGGGMGIPPVALLAAGAAAIYFFTRKSK